MLKKTIKICSAIIVLLLVLAIALPFLFKGKIVQLIKSEINDNLNARVDFSNVDISLFRHFPKISFGLESLRITGTDDFAADTLLAAKQIDVALNLMSVISGNQMTIYSITVQEPRIHAIVHKDGKANWDITKAALTQQVKTETKPFKLELQKYAIQHGTIYYRDESANMSSEIVDLNHEGTGDFALDQFTVKTKTTVAATSFTYGGIPYLVNTKTMLDADIVVDNHINKYSFKTDKISLNGLGLTAEGFFQFEGDSAYAMDIRFKSPSNDFKSILSLVPSVYKKDFDKIKTGGSANFGGFVKGKYSATQMPAYHIDLGVQNGYFQYPDLPRPVKNINLSATLDNPDGITDHTTIDISKGHIEMDNEPFDFRLLLKKPVSDRYLEASARGKLDLSKIGEFIKLDPGTKIAGLLDADLQAKGNLVAIQKQLPGEFSAKGFLVISKLYYSSALFPQPIQNTSASISIEDRDGVTDHIVVQVSGAHVQIGKDGGDFTLLLKNPATDPYFAGTIAGSFNLSNVSQFHPFEPGTSLAGLLKVNGSFKGKKSFVDKKQYDALDIGGLIEVSGLAYKSPSYPGGVEIRNATLTMNPKKMTLNNLKGHLLETNFEASGSLDNLIGYALKDEALEGTISVGADQLDLNKLMGTDSVAAKSAASGSTAALFAVPKNIDFVLNANVDKLHYDKVDYRHVKGTLVIKDQVVTLKNIETEALDGTIAVSGSYSTRENKKKPDIALTYNVQNLDVQKTFLAFNTVQKLMPVGKFISGKLSSTLTMKGKLGEDMMPDMGTLTGEGSLLLIQGFLSKFQPLDKIASALSINSLQDISLKDIKTYFEFANGKVLVKPFSVKVKDIDMEIGGMHGLDQSIDYVVNMKVPRAMMGEKGNQMINSMVSQVNSKGVPVKISDVVNLKVNLTGTITNPVVKTDLKQAAGSLADDLKHQASELVEAKKAAADSVVAVAKAAAKDTIASVKKQVVQGAMDEMKKQFTANKDSAAQAKGLDNTKKNVEESAKGLLNNFLSRKKKDSTGSH